MSLPPSDDARWFAAEVQPHDAALRAWLHARFPSLRDIDGIVQETYSRVLLLRARNPLRPHAVKPLLFTTAHNLAVDELRRRRIVPMHMLPDDDTAACADDAPGIAETVGRRQELALLAEANPDAARPLPADSHAPKNLRPLPEGDRAPARHRRAHRRVASGHRHAPVCRQPRPARPAVSVAMSAPDSTL